MQEARQTYMHRPQSVYNLPSGYGSGPDDYWNEHIHHTKATYMAWMPAPPHLQPQYQAQRQPILIKNTHTCFSCAPRNRKNGQQSNKLPSHSFLNLPSFLQGDVPKCTPVAHIFNDGMSQWQLQGTRYLNQGAALHDGISSEFEQVLTSIHISQNRMSRLLFNLEHGNNSSHIGGL